MRRPLINDLLLPKPPRAPLFLVRPHPAYPRLPTPTHSAHSTHPNPTLEHEPTPPQDPPSARGLQNCLQQLQQQVKQGKAMQTQTCVKIQRYLLGQGQTQWVGRDDPLEEEPMLRKNSTKTHLRAKLQLNQQSRNRETLESTTMELRKARAAKFRNLRENKQNNDKELQIMHQKVNQLTTELAHSEAQAQNMQAEMAKLQQQITTQQQEKQQLLRQLRVKQRLWTRTERSLRLQVEESSEAVEQSEKKLSVALGQLEQREGEIVQLWGLLQR